MDGVFSMPFMSEKIALSARKQTHAHVRTNGHKGTTACPPAPRQEMPLLFLAHLEQHRLKHVGSLIITIIHRYVFIRVKLRNSVLRYNKLFCAVTTV